MKSPAILFTIVLAGVGISCAASYYPIALQNSSYNADVIVEITATPRLTLATTATLDRGTNNCGPTWFEQGFDPNNPGNGLPPAGSTFAAVDDATHTFQMAPSYAAANGLLIDAVITNGTLTFVAPANYSILSFLSSGSSGGCIVNVEVRHQDGTVESGTFTVFDWFGHITNVAWVAGGRITQAFDLNPEVDLTSGDGRGNPRLYFCDLVLTNTTSPVTSIGLNFASGLNIAHSEVLAVSGAATGGSAVTPIAVTGFDYDFVVEANAPHGGRIISQKIANGTNVWATTQSMGGADDTGGTWYEQGYNLNNAASFQHNNPADNLTGTGLPHPGSYVTNATFDHIYQMPPDYTVNNAIYLSTVVTNDTITLAAPSSYGALSFLGAANHGPITIKAVINHQSGSSETNLLTINDWFNGSAPYAFIANGSVTVEQAWFHNVNSGFPRVLQSDMIVQDVTHPITSIYFENTNTAAGELAIFAISGNNGIIPPPPLSPPASVAAYVGSSCSFSEITTATAPINYQWQKGTNNVFANVTDGGNISGATTTNLNINPIQFSDQASYRLVVSNAAGFSYSGPATLTVFSTNLDITQPGDPITAFGGRLFGDGQVPHAIDNDLSFKFGMVLSNTAPFPSGFVVSPNFGFTLVNALRIYTAGDAPERDPADFKLEGSRDGGITFTLIASNSLTLPDGRNTGLPTESPPNPLTSFVQEVRFANSNPYTTYRLTFMDYKGGTGATLMQVGEVELLGDVYIVQHPNYPSDERVFNGSPASLVMPLYPTPFPTTLNWSKRTNRIFVPLTDGGNILGSQTTNLMINPATYADATDYILIASNILHGAVTSSIVHLYVYSTNTDISRPDDKIVGFGDATGTLYSPNNNPTNAIDNRLTEWINGGSGPWANAGFPPFAGPVGIVISPGIGKTVLNGLRIYPGQSPPNSDPNSFVLEGSNNGGTNYALMASGPLSLPVNGNTADAVVNPTQAWAQEILFSNTNAFSSYRLTFPSVSDANAAALLEVGEVEFLGVSSPALITEAKLKDSSLYINGAGGTPGAAFSLVAGTNLAQPPADWITNINGTFDGNGNFSVTLTNNPANPSLFYRLKLP